MNGSGGRARIGVVGAGWWVARQHLPTLLDESRVEVVGVCDADGDRARDAAESFGIAHATDSVDELLALRPAGVLVATSNASHHGPALAAIRAGCHVMVEKPLTTDPAQAWELVDAAAEQGVHLHTGYTFVHSVHAGELRRAVAEGELGELSLATGLFCTAMERMLSGDTAKQAEQGARYAPRPSTYADGAAGGGQAQTQLTHALSLLLWLCGRRPLEVSATSRDRGLAVDVVDALTLGLDGGAVATVATTGAVFDHEARTEEYRLLGTEGQAALDTRRGTLLLQRRGHEDVRVPDLPPALANPFAGATRALLASVLGEKVDVRTDVLGATTVAVLAAAAESARSGRAVPVPGPAR